MRSTAHPHSPDCIANVRLLCPNHPLDKQLVVLRFNKGLLASVELFDQQDALIRNASVFDAKGAFACLGFTDLFCTLPCPGAEHRETFASAAAAAQAGGFTHVAVHSDVGGGTNHLSAAQLVLNSSTEAVQFLPTGNVTQGQKGEAIAELYDLANAGVVAYTDGQNSVQSLPLLLKALQYSLPTGKPIVQLPLHGSLGKLGLMNEGVASTLFGMPGSPSMAEWVKLQTELELLRYAGGVLHYTGVSTAKSIELLEAAKVEGLQVSYSLHPMHLLYSDEDLEGYDTNYKLFPCLRTKEDRQALQHAAATGGAIAVASHHLPQHTDAKDCEFEYAKPGVIGLQTTFHQLLLALPDIDAERVAQLLSYGPRNLLGLPSTLNLNEPLSLTLFTLDGDTVYLQETNHSRSRNQPLLGRSLPGQIVGTYHSGNLHSTNHQNDA